MATLDQIDLTLLQSAPLKNEEVIALLSFITLSESIEPYKEHLQILYNKYDMTLETRPLEIEVLSLRDKFSVSQLRKLYLGWDDQGYHSLLPDLITYYQTDHDAVIYAQNLEKVFAYDPDFEFVRDIVRILHQSEMEGPGVEALLRYFYNKLDRISPYAPIPNYIHTYQIDPEKLPQITPPKITSDVPKSVAASIIAQELETEGLYLEGDDEENTSVLTEALEALSPEDYSTFVESIQVDPEELREVRLDFNTFRVYGPCNPYPEFDLSKYQDEDGLIDANVAFGGPRMFLDMSQEYDYDNDLEENDWFVGHCIQCSLKIKAYHYAVREPGIYGGWFGCFCKWDCVRDYLASQFDEDDEERYNVYVVKKTIINRIEEDMEKIGIAEREYEEPEMEGDEVTQVAVERAAAGLPKV